MSRLLDWLRRHLIAPQASPEQAYLNPDLMFGMRILNEAGPTAYAQHDIAYAALHKTGLTTILAIQLLLRTGWPVDLQVLALQARLSEAEIERHLNEGTRPDAHGLLTLALLNGSDPS